MQQSQPPPKTGNRLRLDIQSQLPPYHMIDLAYTESKTRRGCLVEIPWRTKKPGQLFTLTCQWEDGAELPVWSLYEQAGEDSKMHWSKPFGSADLQLLYDMAAMSAVDSDGAKIPDTLKAKENQKIEVTPPPQPGYAAPPPGYAQGPPPSGSDFTQGTMPAYQNPYGGYPPPGYAMPQQMYPPPPLPGYPPMPGYPQMPQQMYPGMPGMMPGMPGDPNAWMQQGMPQGMPGMMPGMAPGVAPGMAAPMPPAPPVQQSQAQTAITPLVGDSGVFKRIDMSLISKTQTLDIGTLLLNAHLIKQSTLEAALKIQGMVDDGKLDPEIAPAALERFHGEGSKIDNYLTGDVLEKMRDKAKQAPAAPPQKPAPSQASGPSAGGAGGAGAPGAAGAEGEKQAAPVKKGQKSPEEIQKIRNAFDLLKQAGIITDTDIQTAQTVLRKHGGDIVEILVSAGKFDKNTFEAAHIVRPLIDATLMKLEQAIIVLNYCCRSRVDFDTAIDEMGWQNPRKLRTDLNLEK